MGDSETTVAELKALQAAFVAERDWARFHTPRQLAMAISVEAAELLELYLWGAEDTLGHPLPDAPERGRTPPTRDAVEAELADVAICLLNFANAAGVDLSDAVRRKAALNAQRYPAARARGRAEKYDRLAGDEPG